MIEYLSNAIRATAGTTLNIAAKITDEEGAPVTTGAHFMLFDESAAELLVVVNGSYYAADDYWEFVIEKDLTANKCGRYWYCICVDTEPLCFKQPFYLCK